MVMLDPRVAAELWRLQDTRPDQTLSQLVNELLREALSARAAKPAQEFCVEPFPLGLLRAHPDVDNVEELLDVLDGLTRR